MTLSNQVFFEKIEITHTDYIFLFQSQQHLINRGYYLGSQPSVWSAREIFSSVLIIDKSSPASELT